MAWTNEQTAIKSIDAMRQGNVLLLMIADTQVTNVFSGFAERRITAEQIAAMTCKEVQTFLNSQASVSEYLADQLLLPMALTGAGSLITTQISPHCKSNMAVIQQFLAIEFKTKIIDDHSVCIVIKKQC